MPVDLSRITQALADAHRLPVAYVADLIGKHGLAVTAEALGQQGVAA